MIGAFDRRKNIAAVRKKSMAFVSEIETPRLTLEQLHARECLQLAHRLGDDGGRDAKHGRGGADFSAFCHRDEIADLPKSDQRHKPLRSKGAAAFRFWVLWLPAHSAFLCTPAHQLITMRLAFP